MDYVGYMYSSTYWDCEVIVYVYILYIYLCVLLCKPSTFRIA